MHMTYEIYCYGIDSKGKKSKKEKKIWKICFSLEHSLEQQYQSM